jgi:hypothetical protein
MQKGGAKEKCLKHIITDFAISILPDAKKDKWNKAWAKMWRQIGKLEIFK